MQQDIWKWSYRIKELNCEFLGGIKVERRIMTPLNKEQVSELKAGDSVLLSGFIYTA
jgi:hypothetical protein